MWLFFLTIALLIMYYYRSSLRVIAKNMKVNGVEIEEITVDSEKNTIEVRAGSHF